MSKNLESKIGVGSVWDEIQNLREQDQEKEQLYRSLTERLKGVYEKALANGLKLVLRKYLIANEVYIANGNKIEYRLSSDGGDVGLVIESPFHLPGEHFVGGHVDRLEYRLRESIQNSNIVAISRGDYCQPILSINNSPELFWQEIDKLNTKGIANVQRAFGVSES